MMSDRTQELDFVAELRLRRWARRNHVVAEERRDADWHPIVLDEMLRVDRDRYYASLTQTIVTSTGPVSLEASRHNGIRIDQPRAEVPVPNIRLTKPANAESETLIRNCV
ncbi:MAG: hypothetical protein O3B13_11945 [Planctomycetota bacterium]|nr:hypothetical protein [Planctomycetota bacterium]MDA1163806.1 hypothetical protein [Planctomycetota bacterium]